MNMKSHNANIGNTHKKGDCLEQSPSDSIFITKIIYLQLLSKQKQQ